MLERIWRKRNPSTLVGMLNWYSHYAELYGVSLKKNRTGQMGLVFIVPDFESLDFVLDINHVPHTAKDDCRIVDISKETGAFFVFKTK